WLDTVRGRGQAGALLPNGSQTDVGPWGGSIGFDNVRTKWYFGLSPAVPADQLDFYTVAPHELGHLLGVLRPPAQDSWTRLIANDTFTGAHAEQLFGGPVPVDPSHGHWQHGVQFNGGSTTMDPIINAGHRVAFTALDYAALEDIGWQVTPL